MARSLVWFRRDLRVDDHEALAAASTESDAIACVYILPEAFFAEDRLGFPRVGAYRRRFLAESLEELRQALRARGHTLFIRRGEPASVLATLAERWRCERVYAFRLPGTEEATLEASVETRLPVRWFWGHTLVHRDDLPYAIEKLPRVFTEFRKRIEPELPLRDPIPTPTLPPSAAQAGDEPGDIATEVALLPVEDDPRAVLPFRGGTTAALARLEHYFWKTDKVATYQETRNGLLGADYSTKLSPWLADGSLSPRRLVSELSRYERERTRNESTYWVLFELLWRDFFQWVLLQHGTKLFRRSGILDKKVPWVDDEGLFERWRTGTTGVPFVDASLRELRLTGWMSNRGRQNVAAFLAKSMRLPWTWGARWFESQLVDFDVASNWGNWNYTSGVGNDPRANRWFDPVGQGERYDPEGDFVRTWIPELARVPGGSVHGFYRRRAEDRKALAPEYPPPCEGAFPP